MSARESALDAALGYAAGGWAPFPCKPQTKEPATAHGFKDASNSAARIRAWWTACPDYNVAIPTGYPGPDVLDVDVREDGDGWRALNELKRAGLLAGARALVRTPSGGLHVYFAGSDQPCGRLPGRFLDFKARGGYVLAPPSVVTGKSYELLDHRAGTAGLDWRAVRQLLEPPSARERPGTSAGAPGDMTDARRAGILRYAAESNTKGGWATALFNAGCLYAKHGASLADTLADVVPAADPWNDHEAARAQMHVRNGWQRGNSDAQAVTQ